MNRKFIPGLLAFALILGSTAFGQGLFNNSSTLTSPQDDKKPQLSTDKPNQEPDLTTIHFTETSFDFGEITQGEVATHSFEFTNTGKNDLFIKYAKPGCDCTTLEYPTDAVKPGEKGSIDASFDSKDKSGNFERFITVIYNGLPKVERVSFKIVVNIPEGGVKDTEDKTEGPLKIDTLD